MSEISFKYIFEDDYNPIYVNGAFGGIGPQGEVIVNFYCERGAIPKKLTHNIKEDGGLTDPIEIEPKDLNHTLIRYIKSGVILDQIHARELYNWLGGVLDEKHDSEDEEHDSEDEEHDSEDEKHDSEG